MDLGIRGRNALVLAGGGGLGRAIAVALAREGVNVAVADVNPEAVSESVDVMSPHGVETLPIVWDLADIASVDTHVRDVEGRLGPVDILVNITGGPPPTPASGQDPSLWMKSFQSMVLSVIAITDRVLPSMRSRKWGRIITSTSSGVLAPIANLGVSNALRMSLVGWSKTLSREIARDGITANVVVPGRIATKRVHSLDEARAKRENRSVESVVAESTGSIPVGRYGNPEEYAAAVAFLASAPAAYITGSVLRVDGGLIASV